MTEELVALVADRYELVRLIGRGGFAAVWEARDHGRDEAPVVALKLVRSSCATPWYVPRVLREPLVSQRVQDPSIRRVLRSGLTDDELPFVVMELLDGEDLRRRIEREQVLAVRDAVAVGRGVANSLVAMHATGIVHRNVKPENVFLVSNGATAAVRLLDLDSVRLPEDDDADLLQLRLSIGTMEVMAPEQFNTPCVNGMADIFSLGVLLYHMLTGMLPFPGSTAADVYTRIHRQDPAPLRLVRPEVSPPLEALIMRMLSARPENRLAAQEARDELGAIGAALGPDPDP